MSGFHELVRGNGLLMDERAKVESFSAAGFPAIEGFRQEFILDCVPVAIYKSWPEEQVKKVSRALERVNHVVSLAQPESHRDSCVGWELYHTTLCRAWSRMQRYRAFRPALSAQLARWRSQDIPGAEIIDACAFCNAQGRLLRARTLSAHPSSTFEERLAVAEETCAYLVEECEFSSGGLGVRQAIASCMVRSNLPLVNYYGGKWYRKIRPRWALGDQC